MSKKFTVYYMAAVCGLVLTIWLLSYAVLDSTLPQAASQPPLGNDPVTGVQSSQGSGSSQYRFGLDPVGQAIVKGREETLSQERRIRLIERQVAQLQRIVFGDQNIRAPRYQDELPAEPVPDAVPDIFLSIPEEPPK